MKVLAIKRKSPIFINMSLYKEHFSSLCKVRRSNSNNKIEESSKSYCGVLLDRSSQDKLKLIFQHIVPDGWVWKCHHMTIDPFKHCSENFIGTSVNLMVTYIGKSDTAIAVKVVGYKGQTNNAFPHVTIAINESIGGSSKDSNKIVNWTPITQNITLTGTIENL